MKRYIKLFALTFVLSMCMGVTSFAKYGVEVIPTVLINGNEVKVERDSFKQLEDLEGVFYDYYFQSYNGITEQHSQFGAYAIDGVDNVRIYFDFGNNDDSRAALAVAYGVNVVEQSNAFYDTSLFVPVYPNDIGVDFPNFCETRTGLYLGQAVTKEQLTALGWEEVAGRYITEDAWQIDDYLDGNKWEIVIVNGRIGSIMVLHHDMYD